MTGHPGRRGHHVGGLGFGNLRHDEGQGSQIRSGPAEDAALEGQGTGSGVLGNHDLREASEGEREAMVTSI